MKKKMKMKNDFSRPAALLLTLLLTLSALCACTESNNGEQGSNQEEGSEEIFSPATDREGELSERYDEYEKNAALAFKNSSPMSADSFLIEEIGDEVKIIEYIGDETLIVIPEEIGGKRVSTVGESAFSGSRVRAVFLPDSVRSIEKGAFYECTSLATLRLPFVGDGGENTYLGYIFGADEPMENAVSVPPSLDMVILGERCTSVADEAFRGCKTLSAVLFDGGLEEIGRLAFYQCTDLVYISLEKVTGEIDELAFAYCQSLYFADTENSETVANGAFYMCTSLNGISVNLSDDGFLGHYFGAQSADFNDEFVPESLRRVIVGEGCVKIPDRALTSCKYITAVTLPSSLEGIGVRAFYACRSLSGVTIPDSVRKIEDDAFFGCDNLVELSLGDSLESIGMQAFYACGALKSLECPESLREIKSAAFYGCSSLVSVTLGGVERLGKDAFGNCQRLAPLDLSGIEVEE